MNEKSQSHRDIKEIGSASLRHLEAILALAEQLEVAGTNVTVLRHEVTELAQQWADAHPRVAVIGAFSSGKSTLLNRLLGLQAVPVSRTPTTAVATVIRQDSRRHGVLQYRQKARLTLLQPGEHPLDTGALAALMEWFSRPEFFHVKEIHSINEAGEPIPVDSRKLLPELKRLWQNHHEEAGTIKKVKNQVGSLVRKVDKRATLDWHGFDRAFEVCFHPRPDEDFALDTEDQLRAFGDFITEPAFALTLHRVTLCLPDTRLKHLTFLDTAGLCSPLQFHKEVTLELLERRPDKLLVLLDARRLSSPTNHEGLRVLKKFVSSPQDYRQVTFLFTFWDQALYTHMVEDSNPELDFSSRDERLRASDRFLQAKRGELEGLLTDLVGVPCEQVPTVFPTGLGSAAPPELQQGVDQLWKHLIAECEGWMGLDMWSKRWRAAGQLGARLVELHASRKQDIRDAMLPVLHRTDFAAEKRRIEADRKSAFGAIARASRTVSDAFIAQRAAMLATIATLDSKASLKSYCNTGFDQAARAAADVLQAELKRACETLKELGHFSANLHRVTINKRLIGLSADARSSALDEITGFGYGAGAVWDFIFGGIVNANDGNRAAARRILAVQVGNIFDVLWQSVASQFTQFQWLEDAITAEAARRKRELESRQADNDRFLADLARQDARLDQLEPSIHICRQELEAFHRWLRRAEEKFAG